MIKELLRNALPYINNRYFLGGAAAILGALSFQNPNFNNDNKGKFSFQRIKDNKLPIATCSLLCAVSAVVAYKSELVSGVVQSLPGVSGLSLNSNYMYIASGVTALYVLYKALSPYQAQNYPIALPVTVKFEKNENILLYQATVFVWNKITSWKSRLLDKGGNIQVERQEDLENSFATIVKSISDCLVTKCTDNNAKVELSTNIDNVLNVDELSSKKLVSKIYKAILNNVHMNPVELEEKEVIIGQITELKKIVKEIKQLEGHGHGHGI